MQIIQGLENISRPFNKAVVTVGNFDGVHRGHQALFAEVKSTAQAISGRAVAVTFYPHPLKVLSPSGGPPLLTVRRRKEELIASSGMDALVTINFNQDFAAIDAGRFVNDILIKRLGMVHLVMGFDSTIGRKKEGSVECVRKMAQESDFGLTVVEPVLHDDRKVSSTLVRDLIGQGSVKRAAVLLGRPYQISGQVMEGFHRGGKVLGFPTANLHLYNEVIPAHGVYAVNVTLGDGSKVKGVTNVGTNPTFENKHLTVETFLLDFDGELYGQLIRLDFVAHIRKEMKFPGPEALAEQISRDIDQAREELR